MARLSDDEKRRRARVRKIKAARYRAITRLTKERRSLLRQLDQLEALVDRVARLGISAVVQGDRKGPTKAAHAAARWMLDSEYDVMLGCEATASLADAVGLPEEA